MSDQVEIQWDRDGDDITVTATLGVAKILLQGDLEDDLFAHLINSAAAIMNAVIDQINQEEE